MIKHVPVLKFWVQ